MKKIQAFLTGVFFIATFLLNLSFDSNGNFQLFKSAKAEPTTYTGPSVWNCYGSDGKVFAYATVCTDEGDNKCVPTACPFENE
ncbi:MAG: hypothetical protein QM610_00185 [Chitinophagaceae bacterium]